MNITLRDLIRWPDSGLRPVAGAPAAVAPAAGDRRGDDEAGLLHPDRALSWPVAMRATAPMLPHIDDGAIVLLPSAALAEMRPTLPGALHELRRRGVAALVLEQGQTLGEVAPELDVLYTRDHVAGELELRLTRLLNERRARLYRRGTELDRALAEATLRGQGPARLLQIGASQSGRTLLLLDERGAIGEAYGPVGEVALDVAPQPPAPPLGVDTPIAPVADPAHGLEWLLCPLDGSAGGWLALCGPRGALDEVDRLLIARVATACTVTMSRRAPARLAPGRRAALIAELLRAGLPPNERAAHVDILGLNPAGAYAIALAGIVVEGDDGRRALHALRRALGARVPAPVTVEEFTFDSLGALGLLLHAGEPAAVARAGGALRAAAAPSNGASPRPVVALSDTIQGADRLPVAGRQAQYALLLARAGLVPGPFVGWQAADDLGPYRLLYPLWGTPEAARFAADILGDLPEYDTRYGGELLPTLLAYLRCGGAAGTAAAQLAIHRNTLTYRLRRIEEICRRSPLDPGQQLSLHLAALLHALPAPAET